MPNFLTEKNKRIIVRVIPNAKKENVVKEKDKWKIYVSEPAIDGKANRRLIEILSEALNVKRSQIKILRGERAREKVVEIVENTDS